MAIFKKTEPQPQKPRERTVQPARNVSGDAAISIIGLGMTVVGDVSTEGIVRVEGTVRGTVSAGNSVILGQAGLVDGDIVTDDAVIGGTVSGSIVANNRLELQSTCTVTGEIRTRAEHLKLEEGARFTGQVNIISDDAHPHSRPAALPPGKGVGGSTERGPATAAKAENTGESHAKVAVSPPADNGGSDDGKGPVTGRDGGQKKGQPEEAAK